MKCPPEVERRLLDIIYYASGNIMQAARAGDSERCEAEAEHVHNLPGLLLNYKPRYLRFYWDDTRPRFIEKMQGKDIRIYYLAWDKLRPIAEQIPSRRREALPGSV